MIKMIALDLDGTLFDSNAEIPEENKEILQYAHKKGIKIVLSSGRMTNCVTPTADKLGIDCSYISYNGAMVRISDREGRKIIFHKPLQVEYCDMLIDYTLENRFLLNYYVDDKLYCQDAPELKKYIDIYANQTKANYNLVPDMNKFKGIESTKLILITDAYNPENPNPRDCNSQYNYFYPLLHNEAYITKSNPEYLEFMNKEVDKGIGLIKLAEYYGIDISEVIAFGDADNDAPMVVCAGIGVAMQNATEKTKQSAKIISKWDNNDAGVSKILKEYI